MLHTVNKSPFEKNSLETCLRLANDKSSIILIEDNDFHRVHNKSGHPLEFVCIFDGKRMH